MTAPIPINREQRHQVVTADIARTLRLLHAPGSVFEVRALHVPSGRGRGTVSGYFNDPDRAARQVAHALDGRATVYTSLNLVRPEALVRAPHRLQRNPKATSSTDDILRRRWLLLDGDVVRQDGISAVPSTEDEHQRALEVMLALAGKLTAMGWTRPIVADSANGAHLLVPTDLPNDAATTALIQRVLAALAAEVDTDTVHLDTSVYDPPRMTSSTARSP
jgi:hypothetical protein